MSTRFSTEELTFFDQQANKFVERSRSFRDWAPFRTIPHRRRWEWKVLEKIADAKASIDGSRTSRAATTFTYNEAPLMWLGHHFEWSETEVETARDSGNDIATREIELSLSKIDDQIERFLIQGNMAWEVPTNGGIEAIAADAGATADIWDTAGGPYAAIQKGYGVLTNAGFDGPFDLLMSDNLRAGMANEHSAGRGIPAKDAIADAFELPVANHHYTGIGAPVKDGLTVNGFPAPALNDGRWLMMKVDPNYFEVGEVFAPKLTIVPEMDIKRRYFYGRVDWFGTLAIKDVLAFTDEDSVNRVT